jgi:hypothetical protein
MQQYKGSTEDWATVLEALEADEENSTLSGAIDSAMAASKNGSSLTVEVENNDVSVLHEIVAQEDIVSIKSL